MKTLPIGRAGPEVFFRVISPSFAHTPKSGAGAARQGGRFNRPGQEALYLSTDQTTALAEYQQDNPWLPPGTICSFFVQNLIAADFRRGFNPNDWPPLWADYDVDWRDEWFNKKNEPPTWYMADDVVAAHQDGILFPSQAHLGGINLVLYRSSQRPDSQLDVYDPNGDLEKLARRVSGQP